MSTSMSYCGILLSFNLLSIYIVTKVSEKLNINIKFDGKNANTFKFSSLKLKVLSSTTTSISSLWAPLQMVLLSKDYYIIDDEGVKNPVEISFKVYYVFGSLILFTVLTLVIMTLEENSRQFNNMLSKQTLDNKVFNNYISEHGYYKLFYGIFQDCTKEIRIGFSSAIFYTLFQLLSVYSIDSKISVTINWNYLFISYFLKGFCMSLSLIGLYRYRLFFFFDEGGEPILLYIIVASCIIGTISVFVGEYAVNLSTNDHFKYEVCVDTYTITPTALLFSTIIIDRIMTFVVQNIYAIPSLSSWIHSYKFQQTSKQYQNKIADEEAKSSLVTKVLKEMLPLQIAKQLIGGGHVMPEKYQSVLIFYSDPYGFTTFADGQDPLSVFQSLDLLYSVMDYCVSQFPELNKGIN